MSCRVPHRAAAKNEFDRRRRVQGAQRQASFDDAGPHDSRDARRWPARERIPTVGSRSPAHVQRLAVDVAKSVGGRDGRLAAAPIKWIER